uniref:Uncharacterized protein n=1 Tax=Rhizophora mucronata TaxID=61149 RepID=A0A2P2P734_RHIMU
MSQSCFPNIYWIDAVRPRVCLRCIYGLHKQLFDKPFWNSF